VINDVVSRPLSGGTQFSCSNDGALVYLPGGLFGARAATIQWLDQTGRLSPLRAKPGLYDNVRFSPDGTKLAFQVAEGRTWDVWVYEFERDTMSKLTFDEVTAPTWLAWSPDGSGLVFTSRRGAALGDLFWRRADGTGESQLLSESTSIRLVRSWHPSGKYLALTEVYPQNASSLMILPVEGDSASGLRSGRAIPFVGGNFLVGHAAFSPDGRWLAYFSNESGQVEVHVRPFPAAAGQWQVSSDGGNYPIWSPDGRELFYLAPDSRLMVVSYSVEGGSFHAEKPRPWCDTRVIPWGGSWFDLHPDGKRFAVIQTVPEAAEARHRSVVLVQNFFDELRRLAPPK